MIKENTNSTIAINSIILYVRLIIVALCGLLYTRYSLLALGVDDFGLFSVIACILSFASILNTIMVVTSNRYIAIAIGKGDNNEANISFNINLTIHIIIAILTIAIAIPIGYWYINNYVTYQGNLNSVKEIFNISIIASAISFIGVPYNGLLLARERFLVFCSTDVIASLFKLICTYILIDHFENKLIIYAFITAIMTAYPTIIFIYYCNRNFKEITRFRIVTDTTKYISVIKFSLAIGYGALATIAKTQGSALIINMFFSTAMNAGLAVANSVSSMLQLFANNAQKSISPQIVKSYASGNNSRSVYLVCLASRVTYLLMFAVSIPFIFTPEIIFQIWLKNIPPYAIAFTRLLIVDILILSINAGITDYIYATGKIKIYQIVINTLVALSVVAGFYTLKNGMKPENLFYIFILFSFIIFIIRPIILLKVSKFNIKQLIKESYIPVFIITVLTLPLLIFKPFLNAWALLCITYTYFTFICIRIGLNKKERTYLINKLQELFRRTKLFINR